jgi:hypothetical protein
MGRWGTWLMVLALCGMADPVCRAQNASVSEDVLPSQDKAWPLRLHILAIDDTHRTVRLQPQWGSASLPDVSSGEMSAPSSEGAQTLGGGEDDFSGAGRADLVTPPNGTVGLKFTYEGCSRIRVPMGFQGLEARWSKPGAKLEVRVPTDVVTNGPSPVKRCTLKLVTQPFVYLRLRNGTILRVSEDAFKKKPSLRVFLSGGSETLQRRAPKQAETGSQPSGV